MLKSIDVESIYVESVYVEKGPSERTANLDGHELAAGESTAFDHPGGGRAGGAATSACAATLALWRRGPVE